MFCTAHPGIMAFSKLKRSTGRFMNTVEFQLGNVDLFDVLRTGLGNLGKMIEGTCAPKLRPFGSLQFSASNHMVLFDRFETQSFRTQRLQMW